MYLKLLGYFLYFLLIAVITFAVIALVAFLVSCAVMHCKPTYGLKLLLGKVD